jgi:surfeit locus 1 family protein
MHFRPYPLLTAFAIPALLLLLWLGVWQAQRAGWKAAEVASFADRLEAPATPIETVCADGFAEQQIITRPPAGGAVIRVFGARASGRPGWKLLQASGMCTSPVLVQVGFEELAIGGPGGVSPAPAPPWPDRYIVAPWPEKPFMSGQNDPVANEWHWMDPSAIATSLDQPRLDTRFVLLPLDGMPDFLVRTPPETHVGYAVTWFGMAIAFVVIYGLFHMRAGRLRFGASPDMPLNEAKE